MGLGCNFEFNGFVSYNDISMLESKIFSIIEEYKEKGDGKTGYMVFPEYYDHIVFYLNSRNYAIFLLLDSNSLNLFFPKFTEIILAFKQIINRGKNMENILNKVIAYVNANIYYDCGECKVKGCVPSLLMHHFELNMKDN